MPSKLTVAVVLIAAPFAFFPHPGAGALQASPQIETTAEAKPKSSEAHEDLDALLWMQTSAEYRAITEQTFRLAEMNLGRALVDPSWTASLAQQKQWDRKTDRVKALPPAVIMDVDETVLDNTAYQTRLIQNQSEFDPVTWNKFVEEEMSIAVPGAVDFVKACRDAQVTVLFVTNREFSVEPATRRNLIKVGLLRTEDPDWVFSKNERQTWTSNKQSRRAHLASQYRILMILGDDLNDFVPQGDRPTATQRRKLAERYSDRWGHRWFMLPNPNYGGWERALIDWQDREPRSTKIQLKRSNMRN